MREHLGELLRAAFVEPEAGPLPQIFLDLLARLAAIDTASRSSSAASSVLTDSEFKRELTQVIPHLRAFGRSLSGSRDLADDLVQETMLRAWAARDRFQAGSSFRAWTFAILRNHFFSEARRAKFRGAWDPLAADQLLARPAEQDKKIELDDVQRALMQLPQAQREALVLIGAGGFSYDEAAAITGCMIGTVKSRVSRARVTLEQLISEGQTRRPRHAEPVATASAFDALMAQVDDITGS